MLRQAPDKYKAGNLIRIKFLLQLQTEQADELPESTAAKISLRFVSSIRKASLKLESLLRREIFSSIQSDKFNILTEVTQKV